MVSVRLRCVAVYVLFAMLSQLAVFPALAGNQNTGYRDAVLQPMVDVAASEIEGIRLDTMEDAENYADRLRAEYTAEFESVPLKERPPIPVIHIGDDVPVSTRRVIAVLERVNIPVELYHIRKEEVRERFDEIRRAVESRSLDIDTDTIRYDDDRPFDEAIEITAAELQKRERGFWNKAWMATSQFLGLVDKVTLWVTVKRSPEDLKKHIRSTFMTVATGTPTFTLTLMGAAAAGETPNLIAGPVVFAGWVALNFFLSRQISEVQGQGRVLVEVPAKKAKVRRGGLPNIPTEGTYQTIPAPLLQRSLIFGRSIITNAIITAGVWGIWALEDPTRWKIALLNASLTLFSRFFFEEWSLRKAAPVGPDGKVLDVEKPAADAPFREKLRYFFKGPHHVSTTDRFRFHLEFWNGIAKNLHLVNIPGGKYVFWALGFLGVGATIDEKRPAFSRWWKGVVRRLRHEEPADCQTWLMMPKRSQSTEAHATQQ